MAIELKTGNKFSLHDLLAIHLSTLRKKLKVEDIAFYTKEKIFFKLLTKIVSQNETLLRALENPLGKRLIAGRG